MIIDNLKELAHQNDAVGLEVSMALAIAVFAYTYDYNAPLPHISKLKAWLVKIGFRPSPLFTDGASLLEEDELAHDIYNALVEKYENDS